MTGEQKEVTFYTDDKGVRITNARLVVPNPKTKDTTTYAMANISAVTTEKIAPNYIGPGLLVGLGLLYVIVGSDPFNPSPVGFGLLLIAAGTALFVWLKPRYDLGIFSSGTKSSALKHKDKAYIDKLVHAIQEAIIHRG